MIVRPADLDAPQVAALIALHLAAMHDHSPTDFVHALPADALRAPDIAVWAAWDGGDLLGIGALRALDAATGEVKSMRTAPAHLRRGVAAALLDRIIATARDRGYRRLSLETGSGPAFEPGLALYRRFGFVDGAAFAHYQPNAFSRFLHLDL